MFGAGRVFAIDRIASRLERAQAQGAEIINFDECEPVAEIMRLTNGQGVDRAIDAVGVDAMRSQAGSGKAEAKTLAKQFDQQVEQVAPEQHPHGQNWHPGDGPSQVLLWAVGAVRKAGSLAIIGVYPPTAQNFPIGAGAQQRTSAPERQWSRSRVKLATPACNAADPPPNVTFLWFDERETISKLFGWKVTNARVLVCFTS